MHNCHHSSSGSSCGPTGRCRVLPPRHVNSYYRPLAQTNPRSRRGEVSTNNPVTFEQLCLPDDGVRPERMTPAVVPLPQTRRPRLSARRTDVLHASHDRLLAPDCLLPTVQLIVLSRGWRGRCAIRANQCFLCASQWNSFMVSAAYCTQTTIMTP